MQIGNLVIELLHIYVYLKRDSIIFSVLYLQVIDLLWFKWNNKTSDFNY